MTVYLDTSCFLKLLLLEVESKAVRSAVAGEDDVVVSSLTRLEAEVTLKGGYLGGRYRAPQWRAYKNMASELLAVAPFRSAALVGSVFETALRQDDEAGRLQCRSLDRLHLAAMEELGLRRLMTHDDAQAAAASALGYRVTRPGRS